MNIFTIIIGDLNTPFSTITRNKVSNYLEEFNNTINQQDLSGIYRTFYLIIENMFFPNSHGINTKYTIILGLELQKKLEGILGDSVS